MDTLESAPQFNRIFINTLILTILTAVIYALGMLGITEPVGRLIVFLCAPALQAVSSVKVEIQNEVKTIAQARTLTRKYLAATEQNLILRSQVAEIAIVQEENRKLREQIGAPMLERFKLAPAKIISKERGITITFDKNTTVSKDSIVVYKNQFVGKIGNISGQSATIVLATDPDMRIPVDIITEDKKIIRGLLIGEFGTGMTVTQIQQDATIKEGDLAVLAKAPGLPEGVLVGEVREVVKRESELFQNVKINASITFDNIDTVFIIQ